MSRRVEVKKDFSSSSSSKTVKHSTSTSTVVTSWKTETRTTRNGNDLSSSSTSLPTDAVWRTKTTTSLSSPLTDASPRNYQPVYARTTTGASALATNAAAKNLFYSFPKTPPASSPRIASSYKDDRLARPPAISSHYTPAPPPVKAIPRPLPTITRPTPGPDDNVYLQTYSKSKRLVYIMNHFKYDYDEGQRDGSLEDVKNLRKTLSQFNVTIKERHDMRKEEIFSMARKQSMKNYKGFDFIIYIIMTHGSANKHLAARDGVYNLERDFIQEMQMNRTWVGVPKVFIIQACRGKLETDATPVRVPPRSPNDILKLFSTYEGYVAYRTTAGTYFIQNLCNKLNDFGAKEELMSIMRRVTQEVSKSGPTPEQSSTLQKALYLGKVQK